MIPCCLESCPHDATVYPVLLMHCANGATYHVPLQEFKVCGECQKRFATVASFFEDWPSILQQFRDQGKPEPDLEHSEVEWRNI